MSEELALRLAEEIVSTQGAAFVRELLRTLKSAGSKVFIGARKSETLGNLKDAIRAGLVSYEDLIEWLNRVEGWGHQHVYLYSLSEALSEARFWTPPVPDRFVEHARKRGIAIANEKKHVLEFPSTYRLGRIAYDGEQLEMVWRKGSEEWRREAEMDEEKLINDDLYRFEAWRQTPERSVMRFTCVPQARRAALFVQIPLGDEHQAAIKTALGTISELFPLSQMKRVDIGDCLALLDHAGQGESGSALAQARGRVRPQTTAFGAYGASIRFHARELPSYAAVPAVRRVRNSLRIADFRGEHGMFIVDLYSGPGLNRPVKMSLHGDDDRIYLYSRMNVDEVWAVLDHICSVAS
jgi:hypothetical protein